MADYTGLLIELVQQRPCLWQKTHPSYKDSRTAKKNNWVDISEIIREKTGEKVNRKYFYLVQLQNI